jgi:hypothetical protein
MGRKPVNTRLRIASYLLYAVCAASIAVGLTYCLSPTIMPYHEHFLGTRHHQLDPRVSALLLLMMRGAGAIFVALGLGLAVLVRGLFSNGDPYPCARLAIGIMSLIPLGSLLCITLSIGLFTPWWAVGFMIVLVILALWLSRSPRMQTKPGESTGLQEQRLR